jgi:hypothetical protein
MSWPTFSGHLERRPKLLQHPTLRDQRQQADPAFFDALQLLIACHSAQHFVNSSRVSLSASSASWVDPNRRCA